MEARHPEPCQARRVALALDAPGIRASECWRSGCGSRIQRAGRPDPDAASDPLRGGLFLHIDRVFQETIYTSFWGLPSSAAGDAIQTVLTARRSSSWLGVISLAGFAWTGRASSAASRGA